MRFYFFLIVTILFSMLVQLFCVKQISIFGIGPQIMLVMVLYFSLNYGPVVGELAGFAGGILLDIFSVSIFGSNALSFTLAGYAAGRLNHKVDEESYLVQALIALACAVLQIIIIHFVSVIFMPHSLITLKYFLVAPVYTAALSPVIFRILQAWSDIWVH